MSKNNAKINLNLLPILFQIFKFNVTSLIFLFKRFLMVLEIVITVISFLFFERKLDIRKKFFSTPPISICGINIIILLFIFLIMMLFITSINL